jgi:KUP system potassium uptake protein
LICRYAKVSLLPNQQRVDQDISSFRLKLPTPELERALCVKECLEKKPLFKNILLFLVLMGTSMVIGDGILTPSMSGASYAPCFVFISPVSRYSAVYIHLENAFY